MTYDMKLPTLTDVIAYSPGYQFSPGHQLPERLIAAGAKENEPIQDSVFKQLSPKDQVEVLEVARRKKHHNAQQRAETAGIVTTITAFGAGVGLVVGGPIGAFAGGVVGAIWGGTAALVKRAE